MSGITLNELEYSWYASRASLGAGATVDDCKRAYYISKGFGGAGKPLSQMEREWLRSVAGASGSGSNYLGDLWREACVQQGVPPGETMNESKRQFFTLVTASP
ncbi:MAG: hypothetical protein ACOY0S_04325 [Patescibacteria group bacterium]